MSPSHRSYLEPTQASGQALVQRRIEGPVVMLNLLRYREVADYSASPELAPEAPISGEAAYGLYVEHTRPLLRRAGGEVLFFGRGGGLLIGPEEARWDVAMLVRHASVEAFLGFARDPQYLAGAGHRRAALEDSRLLPLVQPGPGA